VEPIVNIEGYKILQDSEAAWRVVKEYPYPPTPSEKQVTEDKR
jgi:hypothetical protein